MAILMSFLSFLSQKTYAGEFLRPEVVISRSYPKKVVFGRSHISSNCHFLKMPSTLNHLELEGNIFRIFISL